MVESTCPIFIAAPFISPSRATSSFAVAMARSPCLASACSSERKALAARIPAQRAPCPATRPPRRAVRATREVGTSCSWSSPMAGVRAGLLWRSAAQRM